MSKKNVIKNQDIANMVMFNLNRLDNSFTKSDLSKIQYLCIDYLHEKKGSYVFLDELNLFPNLESLIIKNGIICSDDFQIFLKLTNLRELVLDNCYVENPNLIATLPLTSLSIINCHFNEYSFIYLIKSLKKLCVINGNIDFRKINYLTNLRTLETSYSNVTRKNSINLPSLQELYIDGANLDDLSFLSKCINLQTVSLDVMQYDKNKDLIDDFGENRKILIKNIKLGENNEKVL